VAMAAVSLLGAILSTLVMDKLGRRPLILSSLYGMILFDLLFAIFGYLSHVTSSLLAIVSGYICIFAIVAFSFLYCIGMTTIKWFVAAELTPQNARLEEG